MHLMKPITIVITRIFAMTVANAFMSIVLLFKAIINIVLIRINKCTNTKKTLMGSTIRKGYDQQSAALFGL